MMLRRDREVPTAVRSDARGSYTQRSTPTAPTPVTTHHSMHNSPQLAHHNTPCRWSVPCVCFDSSMSLGESTMPMVYAEHLRMRPRRRRRSRRHRRHRHAPLRRRRQRLRRARAAVPEATRVVFDGSKASTAMCCRRTGGSAPAAQPVHAVAMTSATRRSRRGGDGAHELFRPPNADGIVPHLILGIF